MKLNRCVKIVFLLIAFWGLSSCSLIKKKDKGSPFLEPNNPNEKTLNRTFLEKNPKISNPDIFSELNIQSPPLGIYDESKEELTVGDKIYALNELLGEGSFGRVFSLKNYRDKVLKIYNEDLKNNFIDEMSKLEKVKNSPFPMRIEAAFYFKLNGKDRYVAVLARLDRSDLDDLTLDPISRCYVNILSKV